MWELDHKESWAPKNWCFWTVVLEKTLESPLDCQEIQPVHPKGNQSWIFIGKTDAEAEAPILWPLDAKINSLEKTLMLGKTEGKRRRGQQRMRWLDDHQFNRHESEHTLGDSEGQGSLVGTVHGVAKSWTPLSNWGTTKINQKIYPYISQKTTEIWRIGSTSCNESLSKSSGQWPKAAESLVLSSASVLHWGADSRD